MSTPSDNKNLLAVVTGASSGIGYELAKLFAKEGFSMIIAAENEKIYSVADELKISGIKVKAVQVDLASEVGVSDLYREILAFGLPLDSIAMNAGVGVGGPFIETELAAEINIIDLNIKSLVTLTKKILPDLVQRGTGKILYTSSIAGEMPGPYYAVYAASKAFVQSFSEAIRNEVKESGVTVTALQPGATDTNFFARAGMIDTKAGQSKKDDPAVVAKDGFDAMMKGKDHVVAGSFMNRVQAVASKFTKDSQGAALQGAQTKPNSLN
ncbi:MAG: SDR family NAD(P)-dependent oxidoreductase [Cryobacterium sp.]|nr:SDR family NAD(P)-dependent oxidoreductase [Oligoflexia bacterium]